MYRGMTGEHVQKCGHNAGPLTHQNFPKVSSTANDM